MALSQRQKQVVIEALLRAASKTGVNEQQHRMQLAAMLLRPKIDQQAEAIRSVNELRVEYVDNLAGLDAAVAQQRTQLTAAIAELDELLVELNM